MSDTNQASEDIRNHISRNICHEAYSSEYEELNSVAKWTHDKLVDEIIMPAINALIRTEKLKLLAELEEYSEVMNSDVVPIYGVPMSVIYTLITKLEAEL